MIWALDVRGGGIGSMVLELLSPLLIIPLIGAIVAAPYMLWLLLTGEFKGDKEPSEKEKKELEMQHLRRERDEMQRFRDLQNPEHEQVVQAFLLACRYRLPERIHEFLNLGVDVNPMGKDGDMPLHAAAGENENPEVLTLLITAGADVNAKDSMAAGRRSTKPPTSTRTPRSSRPSSRPGQM